MKAIRPTDLLLTLGPGGVVNAKGGILFFFHQKMVPNLKGWCKFLVEKYQICTCVFFFDLSLLNVFFVAVRCACFVFFPPQKMVVWLRSIFFWVNHITTSLIMDVPKGGWTWALVT